MHIHIRVPDLLFFPLSASAFASAGALMAQLLSMIGGLN